MSTKKIKRNLEKQKKRYIYVGNYYEDDADIDNINLTYKIDLLTKRLNLLESIFKSSNIIKAKPVMSIVSGDINILNKINSIYEKWITYMSKTANSNTINFNVYEIFWQLDNFIFNKYFLSLYDRNIYIFEFVNVNFENNSYTENQKFIIKKGLGKNRNQNFKLLHPHHKEYISTLKIEERFFLIYFEDELNKIINIDNKNGKNTTAISINDVTTTTTNDNNNTNIYDLQFTDKQIQSNLSLDKDVVGEIQINNIDIKKENDENNVFEIPTLIDKRQLILQNKQPLYNTLVDVNILNKLNSTLYRFNPTLLNLSLIVFHAMLHIKRDISIINNNSIDNYDPYYPHDNFFIKEYLNYTPSALYGHAMIPPLTLS